MSSDFAAYVASQSGDHEAAARLGTESLVDARRRGDRYVVSICSPAPRRTCWSSSGSTRRTRSIEEAMEKSARTTPIGPLAARVIGVGAAVDIELGRLSTAVEERRSRPCG